MEPASRTSLYWIDAPVSVDAPRTVHRIGVDGTGQRVLASTGDRTEAITVDVDGAVYWIAVSAKFGSTNALWTVDPSGGEPRQIGPVDRVARSLAVAGGHAYWEAFDLEERTGTVRRMAVTGGEAETIANAQDMIVTLAVDERGPVWLVADGTLATAAPDGRDGRVLMRLSSVCAAGAFYPHAGCTRRIRLPVARPT